MLAVAALVTSLTSVEMNPAQQVTIVVSGTVPPLTATLQSGLVVAKVNDAGTQVTLTATQATGNDVLQLVDAVGDSATIPVRVAFNAGTVPAALSLTVTGNPVDPAWLSAQIAAAVGKAALAAPGAQTTITSPSPPPMAPGVTASIPVPVQIGGDPAYFDQSGVTNVTVQDVPLVQQPAQLLFYDDDPESVDAAGALYRGVVTQAAPVHLYTYHEDTDDALYFSVVLQSPVATRIQTIDAIAGASADVMSVGHAVGVQYLEEEPRDEGLVLALEPGVPYVLHDTPSTNGQHVAECLYLRVLSGGPVSMTVLSHVPGAAAPATSLLPGDGHHRTGVFDLTGFGRAEATYAAGGPDATVTYGAGTPPSAPAGAAGHDFGGYGVLRHIVFTLVNPTDTEANAYLYEQPSGGSVRSSFLVDGSLVQLGCARLPVAYEIQAYGLQPHATYEVRIETMTDGASSYPLTLGITATPPQPQTPPIRSPDGCFPEQLQGAPAGN